MLSGKEIGIIVGASVACIVLFTLIGLLLCWGRRHRRHRKLSNDTEFPKLHFLDYAQKRRTINLTAMGITDGASLRQALAALCGLPDASSLALMYTNEVDRCVEVDLDQLVAPDPALSQRMRQTAVHPLALAPHTHETGLPLGSVADMSPRSPKPEAIAVRSSRSPKSNTVADQPPRSPKPEAIAVRYSRNPTSGAVQVVRRATVPRGEAAVPPPIILPQRPHISATTPVYIVAAQYAVDGGAALTTEDTAAFEEAMVNGVAGQGFRLPSGKHISVDANAANVYLADEGALYKWVAEELHYSVDNTNSAQWYAYRKPIYLPPGRWCVRAEASNADHRIVKTSSRVFTVDLVEKYQSDQKR